jgi:hypothetical protein
MRAYGKERGSQEVDRGRAWRDCEGGHWVFPVSTDVVVPVGDDVVDNSGVGLVYKNDVHRTWGIQVWSAIIVNDNLDAGPTGNEDRYMPSPGR